jgi:hypothetical protein
MSRELLINLSFNILLIQRMIFCWDVILEPVEHKMAKVKMI